ncbi:uncharacterized protein LOC123664584 [Melitaea cinxia]|uniref:uncharacterized protein LOC123664584 n=1 Tax=Melitaea cinxia TaxID=113334 RepID=UPI001E2726D4|nr:uncharacterized protein LOC123664584 [Melitaea cinxia]
MIYNDFRDIKQLPVLRLNKSVESEVVKLSDIKVIKVVKTEDEKVKIYYKKSYLDDFKEIDLGTKRVSTRNQQTQELQKLYNQKLDLSERKKNDVKSLLDAGLIPNFYNSYFDRALN